MFTLNQIEAIHAKVKSGADFPQHVQDMKTLGVLYYIQYVADGHTVYYGNNYKLESPPLYKPLKVAASGNVSDLKHHLKIHQAGETDYLTFCSQSAEDGVEKWVVNMQELTCAYYDKVNNIMVTENIPTP